MFQNTLSRFQQAFVAERDIVVNNVRMHGVFYDQLRQHVDDESAMLVLLLLDCSKGYNYLS